MATPEEIEAAAIKKFCAPIPDDDTIREEVMRIGSLVAEMHEILMALVKGIGSAQQAGGMPGMMARQLPDMSQFSQKV